MEAVVKVTIPSQKHRKFVLKSTTLFFFSLSFFKDAGQYILQPILLSTPSASGMEEFFAVNEKGTRPNGKGRVAP